MSNTVRMNYAEVKRLFELMQNGKVELVEIKSTETGIGQGHHATCMQYGENGWEAMSDAVDITDYSNW